VTRNGIPDILPAPKKESGYVIYASSPDRGLKNLIEWWPEIRHKYPRATLHVFYGFNQVYKRREKEIPALAELREFIESAVQKDSSIIWHGNVGQDVLHDEFSKAVVWAYPTEFNEISCITAMKAQAMGAIPVCSAFAALNETVQYGVKIGSSDYPDIVQNKDKFISAVVSMLWKGDVLRSKMVEDASFRFSMSSLAKEWIDHVESVKARKLVTV